VSGRCVARTVTQVVPWKGLIALIKPHYPKGTGGRPAYPLMAMYRDDAYERRGARLAALLERDPALEAEIAAFEPSSAKNAIERVPAMFFDNLVLEFEKLPQLTDAQVSAGARPGESWD
jgi:hypothetical protein